MKYLKLDRQDIDQLQKVLGKEFIQHEYDRVHGLLQRMEAFVAVSNLGLPAVNSDVTLLRLDCLAPRPSPLAYIRPLFYIARDGSLEYMTPEDHGNVQSKRGSDSARNKRDKVQKVSKGKANRRKKDAASLRRH